MLDGITASADAHVTMTAVSATINKCPSLKLIVHADRFYVKIGITQTYTHTLSLNSRS